MFEKWFAKKKGVEILTLPPPVEKSQQQAPWVGNSTTFHKARQRGISPEEYEKRVKIVEKELAGLTLHVGDTVYPSGVTQFREYGRLLVRGICRHYDDFGGVEWLDTAPFLLQVSPLDKPNHTINCTVSWVSKHQPVENTLYQDC